MKLIRKTQATTPAKQESAELSESAKESIADTIGVEYGRSKEAVDTANKNLDVVKIKIKELSVKHGTKQGSQTRLQGKRFVVGFTERAPDVALDFKKMFRAFPHLKKALTSKVIDHKKVVAAIGSGMITRKMINRFSIEKKKSTPVTSVYVRPAKKGKHEAQED